MFVNVGRERRLFGLVLSAWGTLVGGIGRRGVRGEMWAPPRRNGGGSGGAGTNRSHPHGRHPSTPLQVLLQMGFTRHRAMKALAATGNKSVQLASDWLLAHVNDTTIDDDVSREYIVYACPTGPLLDRLRRFWSESERLFGRNGAHNFTPHITLVSFFKAPDECSLQLSKLLRNAVESVPPPSDSLLNLETYTSPNFMGLFVSEDHAEYLKNIAVQYVKRVSSSVGLTVDTYEQLDALATCFPWCAVPQEPPQPSICLEPHVKSLHLTLAYQFPSNVFKPLKDLVENLVPLDKAIWEVRLYSRDSRLSTHHVHKVKHEYNSVENDELELRLGDYIYIEEGALKNSPDGWVQGISWLTGVTGYLPAVYTERTAESDAWTLHKAITLGSQNLLPRDIKCSSKTTSSDESLSHLVSASDVDSVIMDSGSTEVINKSEKTDIMDEMNKMIAQQVENLLTSTALGPDNDGDKFSNDHQSSTFSNETASDGSKNDNRTLFVIRHGERVDFTYGSWVPFCFDEDDNYTRKDLNMPLALPERVGGSAAYTADCPLTNLGVLQARLVGEGLQEAGATLSHVYSSPSYRCIQTAQSLLEGLSSSIKIKVEPSLFEWLVWYPKGPPMWMTKEELLAAKYNIDMEYEPFMKIGEPPFVEVPEKSECLENCAEFYERNGKFAKHIIKQTEKEGGNILLVGHAITLDTTWRELSGFGVRDGSSLGKVMQGVSYCSLIALQGPPWQLVPPPCPPMMSTANRRFDWKILKLE